MAVESLGSSLLGCGFVRRAGNALHEGADNGHYQSSDDVIESMIESWHAFSIPFRRQPLISTQRTMVISHL